MKVNLIEVMKEEQRELSDPTYARLLGITKVQLHKWYSGESLPTAHSAFKVCKGLGLTDKQTAILMNQLDSVRTRKRNAKRKKTSKLAKKEEYMELSEHFVEAGWVRELTIEELVTDTKIGSRATLERYRKGLSTPPIKVRNIMKRFIEETTSDLIEIEVPKKHPSDYSLISEYIWQINRYKGNTIEDLFEALGVGSRSTILGWRKGKTTPKPDNLTSMIEYVEAYNEELPEEKRIDPYRLIPFRNKPIRIRLKDYGTLHKIERLYGSVGNIPDKHPLLTRLQAEWGIN